MISLYCSIQQHKGDNNLRYVYITLGFIFLAIGAVGIALPILPTTPFLLLTSFCFAKGSKKFNNWFRNTHLFKAHLESFEINRSMTLKTKLCILVPVSLLLIFAFFMMSNIYGKLFIIALIVYKYYYFVFRIKTT